MKDSVKNNVGFAAAVVTIVAFVVELIFSSETSAFIALAIYAAGLTWFVIAVYRLFSKSMEMRSKDGFCRMAATSIFIADENGNAEFQFFRYIQCKVPLLSSIKHEFKWKGNGYPEITSNGTRLNPSKNGDDDEYDHVLVPIGKTLYYNECAVVPIFFKSVRSDVQPVMRHKVEEPIGPIQFKVMLGYKDSAPDAVLYRKKIGTKIEREYEIVKHVPFNKTFKMFECVLDPEVGYVYKFEWTL